jgi:hypothetical protein
MRRSAVHRAADSCGGQRSVALASSNLQRDTPH